MKHFNTLPEGTPDSQTLSESNSDYKIKHFKKEHLPVIILISVGLIGTFYLFNVGFGNKLKALPNKITRHQIINSPATKSGKPFDKNKALQGNVSFSKSAKNQLLIAGQTEVKQLLNFTIENFDKKARYDLHLGDGVILHPKAKSIKYAYQRPGRYQVKLIVNYEGESAQLYSGTIQILKSIKIAPGAHREK